MNRKRRPNDHLAQLDEPRGLLAIDLGPDALCRPRRETLQPAALVVALLLAIDPAVAKRGLDGLEIRDRSRVGAFLGDP